MTGPKSRWAVGIGYAIALAWINLYICRDLFFNEFTGKMNSMHGFWMAIARLASHHWWTPGWWPYWDAGMPFEFTYAPLIPGLTALWSKLAGVSISRAFHSLNGLLYILTAISVFAMSAAVTRRLGWSFIAGVVYSLLAPTQIFVPDEAFAWSRIGDARRLYLAVVWDETPHIAALTALPLVILFMYLGLECKRVLYLVWAGIFMCVALLANAFGLTMLAIGLLCLLLAFGGEHWMGNTFRVMVTGGFAYLLVCPFLPPSLFPAISRNQHFNGVVSYGPGSFTAISLVVLGCALLAVAFRRYSAGRWLRFLGFFAWITLSIPLFAKYLNRTFVPQSGRYNVEAELALAVLAVFCIRPLVDRLPVVARVGLALVGLSLALEQVVNHRKFAKTIIRTTVELPKTIEYRAAMWAAEHIPNARVWYPGSMGQWLNAWSDSHQMTGSSWSTAYNPVHRTIAAQSLYSSASEDEGNAFLWLKVYGVQAIAIPGKNSPEFWKAIARPEMFSGCEVLWREDDTTICRVPHVSTSFAHVVPRLAVVNREPRHWRDVADAKRFVTALDGAAHADLQWDGTDRATIRVDVPGDHALAVQVTHHPGWSATANGKNVPVLRDGLGLIWLDSPCSGPCEVRLTYNGGLELLMCRWVSGLTLVGLLTWGWKRRRLHQQLA